MPALPVFESFAAFCGKWDFVWSVGFVDKHGLFHLCL
jgi:hypothetical protein